jgi:two-component system sensor histidine kinase DegS
VTRSTTSGSPASTPAGGDAPPTLPAVVRRAEAELAALDQELAEIDLLIAQARTEATRHETRRAQAAEKLAAAAGRTEPAQLVEMSTQLAMLAKRAAVMETQVDVLTGKQRTLSRYRESLAGYAAALDGFARSLPPGGDAAEGGVEGAGEDAAPSRVVLAAQEDLRREIARAMHDGPAQSLTNIVLQAQIVDRLLGKDEAMARGELRLLVEMVQQTLDATKSFIFDVRPMVLDDLGLTPTLRRVARERGRRAGVPVEFESTGHERRLPVDLESGIFRIVDEALLVYLEREPARAAVRMSWDDGVTVEVTAERDPIPPPADAEPIPDPPAADVPPALAAMIEDRRRAAMPAPPEIVSLPAATWRDLAARAATLGVGAELLDEGARLRLVAPGSDPG